MKVYQYQSMNWDTTTWAFCFRIDYNSFTTEFYAGRVLRDPMEAPGLKRILLGE
jgi:hypothetical protein